jgi:ketosteroid isomerase-like protein
MNDELRNDFEKLEREWSEAIVSNDAASIGRFMSDDWVIVGQSGISQKDDFLALVASGDLTHEAMNGNLERVRVYGDIAVVTMRGTNSGHYKGAMFNSDEWITDVFQKRNGSWRCVLTQLTPAIDRA